MAVSGTQLYNKRQQKINPISDGEVIVSTALGRTSTVHQDLADLFNQISKLSGDQEAVNNIEVQVKYAKANTKEKTDILEFPEDKWSNDFSLPSMKYPYIWKRTVFGYKKTTYTFYEICAVDVSEKHQTIYIARTTGQAPTIYYPEVDGKKELDYYDDKLPTDWTEVPQSIRPEAPYVFMSTRKTVEGKWTEFTVPAQYGRWAFDSVLELRYRITQGDVPAVDATEDNPGSEWSVEPPTEFTGHLWMITATSVNKVYNKDDVGVVWHGPNLMAIV